MALTEADIREAAARMRIDVAAADESALKEELQRRLDGWAVALAVPPERP